MNRSQTQHRSYRWLTRRDVLRSASAAVGLACGGGLIQALARQTAPDDPLSGARLFEDVVRYSNFGEHRTATEPDRRTSAWLAEELGNAGVAAKLVPWRHQQFFVDAHHLIVGGDVIESFPLWWPAATGPQPIGAPLQPLAPDAGPGALEGKIGLAAMPGSVGGLNAAGNGVGGAVEQAVGQGALGLVMIAQSPTGELVALNAMSGLDRWDIPVLIVGQRDRARLERAAEDIDAASLLLDGRFTEQAEAFEVVGTLERGDQTVVVSTPSSGWFHCAGERGTGIAIWLGLARWAARTSGDASYIFVASSGHEIDAVGIRHFLADLAPEPAAVRTWLHLGAGIATYDYEFGPDGPVQLARPSPSNRLMTNVAEWMPVLEESFRATPDLRPVLSERPSGEMSMMAREGYPVWGLAGLSALHHVPGDLPDRITGPELLEPVARATARALDALASG